MIPLPIFSPLRLPAACLRVTRLKYSQGLISNTDVIDAMLSLSRSRFDLIQALKDYYTNRTRLMRLAGTIEEIL